VWGTGSPKDRYVVKVIRSVAALARILPILALRWAENAARPWMDSFHEEKAREEKVLFFFFFFFFF
jgi:hypothetical protein